MSRTDSYKIMCFTWNAAGLKICETSNEVDAKKARGGFFHWAGVSKSCVSPNFFEEIRNKILQENPKIVLITTQDEDDSKTYFHSDYLPNQMQGINYSLFKRDKLDGVGEPTSKNPYKDLKTVGLDNPSKTAMRVSIYVMSDLINQMEIDEKEISPSFMQNKGQSEQRFTTDGRTIGTIASYIKHGNNKFLFISTHIPSGVQSLNVRDISSYNRYRNIITAGNRIVFHKIFNEVVDKIPNEYKPNHIFIIGDLNYDIHDDDPSTLIRRLINTTDYKTFYIKDELKEEIEQKGSALNGFKEGADGNPGPLFLPTWNLNRNRHNCISKISDEKDNKNNEGCFHKGDNHHFLSIGWHDRIIFQNKDESAKKATCTFYKRLDYKNMDKSTHAGVMGIFEITP